MILLYFLISTEEIGYTFFLEAFCHVHKGVRFSTLITRLWVGPLSKIRYVSDGWRLTINICGRAHCCSVFRLRVLALDRH